MATTTNYGWTTPDDTALVKDGASAIRTLGSSVDTTTKALNPSTTLGDIEYRSSTANTNTRLGIGSTGNVLTVSGGVPTWAAPAGGSMTVLASGSFSNNASLTISSISGSYRDLKLRISNFRPSFDGEQLYMRFNGDTGNNYFATTSLNDIGLTPQNRIMIVYSTDNTASAKGIAETDIINYSSSTTNKLTLTNTLSSNTGNAANRNTLIQIGEYNSATAITSITLLTGTDNITSGTYELLGVN
jgi:hypothetical protein